MTTTIVDISAYTVTSYPLNPSDPWTVAVSQPVTTYETTEGPPYVAPFTTIYTPTTTGVLYTAEVGVPAPDYTSITVLPPWSTPYTSYIPPTNTASTAEWEVIVGSQGQETSITSTLPPWSPSYTSTISPAWDPADNPWTLIYGSPLPYATSFSYLHQGQPAFTSTSGGTVTIGVPVPPQTTTTTIAPNLAAYTATVTGSNPAAPWIVLIATPAPYMTIIQMSILPANSPANTQTSTGQDNTVTVLIGNPAPYYTSTLNSALSPRLSCICFDDNCWDRRPDYRWKSRPV